MSLDFSDFDYGKDIVPLGDYETIPVEGDPNPDRWDNVIRLGVKTDVEQLRKDYNDFPKDGPNYLADRARHFKYSIKKTNEFFQWLGFTSKNYFVYPVRKKGTNEILPETSEYTKNLLENFGVPLFRQQYVTSTAEFETRWHRDHPEFSVHGYRLFIPIDTACLKFDENEDKTYYLEPGDCYFVNIGKMHKSYSTSERTVLMCQMASDDLMKSGYNVY